MYSNTYYNDNLVKAKMLIENNEFKSAYDFLKKLGEKCAQWYYLTGISAMNIGYYEEGETCIKTANTMSPENQEYSSTLLKFSRYRDNYNDRAHRYNRRRHNDLGGCCCCCCDDCCCVGDDCCEGCMKLWCLDSCCECCGGDLIDCC